jgi:4-amino-4-deoxy-L-arabinose transferase-like glycosyltransferase
LSSAFRNVLIASIVFKAALAIVFRDLEPRYDEVEYLAYARDIYEHGQAPQIFRAPGQQWLVAAGLALTGGKSLAGVRLLQVVLSVATSLLVYRLGRRRWGERAGFAAGAFLSFYPTHVAFSHWLWSEPLYTFLIVAAADRLLAADESGKAKDAILAGALLGAGALTRSLGIAVLGASLVWLVFPRPRWRSMMAAATAGIAAGAVVLPWTIHASQRAGRLVLTDLNGGFNFWLGHHEYLADDMPSNWIVGIGLDADMGSRFYGFLPDSAWRIEMFQRLAQAGIREEFGPEAELWYQGEAWRLIRESPRRAVERVPAKVAALWGPDFFLPRHLARDWYGKVPPGLAIFLIGLTWLSASVPLLFGPAGIAAMRPGRFRSLTVFWILVYVAVHGLAYGHSRMQQPLVPFLLLALAAFLFGEKGGDDEHGGPRRFERFFSVGLPWTILAGLLWVLAYPVMASVYLVPNGRHTSLVHLLSIGRHLPVAGADRLDWLLAGAEFSDARHSGAEREARADRVLAESRAAQHPWTLYLRGWIASDPERAEGFLKRAVAIDPAHYPALEMLFWLRREAGDTEGAAALERQLLEARPWAAHAIRTGQLFVTPPVWRNASGDEMHFPPEEWRRRSR